MFSCTRAQYSSPPNKPNNSREARLISIRLLQPTSGLEYRPNVEFIVLKCVTQLSKQEMDGFWTVPLTSTAVDRVVQLLDPDNEEAMNSPRQIIYETLVGTCLITVVVVNIPHSNQNRRYYQLIKRHAKYFDSGPSILDQATSLILSKTFQLSSRRTKKAKTSLSLSTIHHN